MSDNQIFAREALRLFPVRRNHLRTQALQEYNQVIDFRSGASDIISAKDTFILEMFTGEYDIGTIGYIYAGTFRLSEEAALADIKAAIAKYASAVEFLEAPPAKILKSNAIKALEAKKGPWKPGTFRGDKINRLVISLTNYCNHRCCYCSNSSAKRAPDELGGEEWFRVIDDACEMGVQGVEFSGGEPMAHPDFLSIVKYTAEKGMHISLTTNGTYMQSDVVRALAAMGVDFVHLSMSAAHEELYDRIVGHKGNFGVVKNAIRNMKENNFYIRLKMVLMPSNVDEVSDMLDLCRKLNVDAVHLAPFRLTHICRGGGELIPSIAELEKVQSVVEKKREALGGALEIAGPAIGDLRWCGSSDIVRCGGIKTELTVLPNGDITFCQMLGGRPEFKLGNVRNATMKEIWYSDKPEKILKPDKSTLEEPCRSCEHIDRCNTGCFMCSMIYSDNPWSVDPRCWKSNIPGNVFRA